MTGKYFKMRSQNRKANSNDWSWVREITFSNLSVRMDPGPHSGCSGQCWRADFCLCRQFHTVDNPQGPRNSQLLDCFQLLSLAKAHSIEWPLLQILLGRSWLGPIPTRTRPRSRLGGAIVGQATADNGVMIHED